MRFLCTTFNLLFSASVIIVDLVYFSVNCPLFSASMLSLGRCFCPKLGFSFLKFNSSVVCARLCRPVGASFWLVLIYFTFHFALFPLQLFSISFVPSDSLSYFMSSFFLIVPYFKIFLTFHLLPLYPLQSLQVPLRTGRFLCLIVMWAFFQLFENLSSFFR